MTFWQTVGLGMAGAEEGGEHDWRDPCTVPYSQLNSLNKDQ